MGKHFYNLVWTLTRPLYDIIYPRRVAGLENLPAEGGFILCLNHISARDPLFVSSRIPRRRRMYFLAKKELFNSRILKWIMDHLGGIPVDRGHADLSAIRRAMQVLREGFGLGIFPQGTRSRDNSRTPMLNGAAMIALRGGVPVIPAYIDGPYRLFRRTDIIFGSPINLSDFARRLDSESLTAATKRIEEAIWNLSNTKLT